MSDKDEALLLADALLGCAGPLLPILPAAACLRRQHAKIESLKAERDALLKALVDLMPLAEFGAAEQSPPYADEYLLNAAQAAIDAAREGKRDE